MQSENRHPFPPGFENQINNVAVDFDGVIHNFEGWGDGRCYGNPIVGSLESIIKLSEKYKIIVFTAKVRPDRPLVSGMTGTELVEDWLDKHGFSKYISSVTHEKPRAKYYIDDRAIRFVNWKQTMRLIKKIDERDQD